MALATVELGRGGPWITRVGLGTAPIGSSSNWRINWGPQDAGDGIRAIHAAIELGVNWIDTAPFYGWGRAEEIVGKAVHDRRDRVLIFTKCGTVRAGQAGERENLTPANIRREVEDSLRRLGTDRIDLLQFHDPDPETPIEESWAEMLALIRAGKVRYGGLSNHPVELVERTLAVGPVVAHQHQYSLLRRDIERDILPFSRRRHIGVLAWSPLASGFLVESFDLTSLTHDDFRLRLPFAQEPAWSSIERARGALMSVAYQHGKRLEDLAIAWILRQPGMTGAIVGARNQREAERMVDGVDWMLTSHDMAAIDDALAEWERSR